MNNNLIELTLNEISESAPKVAEIIKKEQKDQVNYLRMIASENYNSPAVQAAMNSCLCDRYSEGSIGHRYYSGCQNIDELEQYTKDCAEKLFGCDHAFVQPHSGADANLCAYWAILNAKVITPKFTDLQKSYECSINNKFVSKTLGDLSKENWEYIRTEVHNQRILSMSLESGGHLSHSSPVNVVSQMFNVFTYDVDDNGYIDYDKLEIQAKEVKPLILLAGASAYPRKINYKRFRDIADKVGAVLMCDIAHIAAFCIKDGEFTGEYNPVPYADIITTTTHKSLRAGRGGMILCKEWLAPFVDKSTPTVLGGPLNNMIAAKAVGLTEALQPEFKEYAHQVIVNTKKLADTLIEDGVKLISNGTDNHLLLIDLRGTKLTGKQAEDALFQCGIICNRNSIKNDPNGVFVTSSVRLGTCCLTTRGMKEPEMEQIGDIISSVLKVAEPIMLDNGKLSKSKVEVYEDFKNIVKNSIKDLLDRFPME